MNYIELLKDAAVIVRGKLLWKRFIDGTPLSNDLPFWMADFAAAAVAHERDKVTKERDRMCEQCKWRNHENTTLNETNQPTVLGKS